MSRKLPASKKKQKASAPLKNNTRARTKYAGLKTHLNLKTRADQLDMDYISKLNDKEKAWLNAFIEEEVNSKFDHTGKKFNKTKKAKRKIYSANNARNRCIFTRAKATHTLDSWGDAGGLIGESDGDLIELAEKIEDFQNTLDSSNKRKNSTKK